MNYVEFLVLISRVSHELYKTDPDKKDLDNHLKVDKVLDAILTTKNMAKIWGFKEAEELDQVFEENIAI